jgi:lipoprotein-anchoring transpeptidase ErfK/SrfK
MVSAKRRRAYGSANPTRQWGVHSSAGKELNMRHNLLFCALAGGLLSACSTTATKVPAPVVPTKFGYGHSERAAAAEARVFGAALRLRAGEWKWSPRAKNEGAAELVVSLGRQRAWLYRGGDLAAVTTISSGKPGKDTPVGRFPILEKRKFHKSNRYSAAPMPHMQRLNIYGVALHGGAIPPYPASHGCIRLPLDFAARLYSVTSVGTLVWVED